MKSEELRKRFKFIFEAVSDRMSLQLVEQRKNMSLSELKLYGEKSDISMIRGNFKKLSNIATNLATLSLANSTLYYHTTEKIQDEFDKGFFKYVSYQMKPFLNTMETIVTEAVNSLASANNQLQSCQNEEEICINHLKKAYDFVYKPFEINKFPYETLGFGTYMAYFSRFLLTRPETQQFLERKNLNWGERWVRAYQAEVLSNLTRQNVGNISLLEMVYIVHHNKGDYDILKALKNELNCDKFDVVEEMYLNGEVPCLKKSKPKKTPWILLAD